MRVRFRLKYWRRRWCIWRGHPAGTAPMVMMFQGPDTMGPDGAIVEGARVEQRAWRCARHD